MAFSTLLHNGPASFLGGFSINTFFTQISSVKVPIKNLDDEFLMGDFGVEQHLYQVPGQ